MIFFAYQSMDPRESYKRFLEEHANDPRIKGQHTNSGPDIFDPQPKISSSRPACCTRSTMPNTDMSCQFESLVFSSDLRTQVKPHVAELDTVSASTETAQNDDPPSGVSTSEEGSHSPKDTGPQEYELGELIVMSLNMPSK